MSLRHKIGAWIAGVNFITPNLADAAETPAIQNSATVRLSELTSLFDLVDGLAPYSVSSERAMKHSAVYACARIIGGTIAQLPLKHYESGDGDIPKQVSGSPIGNLLRLRPNPEMSASMLWRHVLVSGVVRGNGYAWIDRDGAGRPRGIYPVADAAVEPVRTTLGVAYRFTLYDGRRVVVPAIDVIHFPGSIELDSTGLKAKSPLSAAATAIGIALDADDFARQHLANDATPPGIISFTGKVSAEQKDLIRDQWQKMGTGDKRGNVKVLGEGGKFESIKLTAEDAQLLETRRFQIEDIARVFGVPPHMIGALDKTTSWGTGVEQQSIGFVQYTLGMHIKALEQELEWKLFDGNGEFAEFDVRALMRGDAKTRSESYRLAVGGSSGPGWMTPDEVRALENLPPVEGGGKLTTWTQGGGAAGAKPKDSAQ